jgi:hypothetical protein
VARSSAVFIAIFAPTLNRALVNSARRMGLCRTNLGLSFVPDLSVLSPVVRSFVSALNFG